jgi:ABC-type bacteriocin/lantibiotic exporter with double-glycine peptidase domain
VAANNETLDFYQHGQHPFLTASQRLRKDFTHEEQFTSIEKVDTAILYALELASSLSVLLLAFGLIASMANVLTKGAVLTENIFMQRVWAWTQCIVSTASKWMSRITGE